MNDSEKAPDGRAKTPAYSARVVIPNQKGLHARASAQFVKCAECFDADVRVTHDGQTVLGKSIMGLMMLAAGKGNAIVIETRGPEAKAALKALETLVNDGFNEES